MTDLFKQFSHDMLPALEQEMQKVLQVNQESKPDAFYGMMHYHMGWADPKLNPTVVKSGKRIRPLSCLISTQAAGGQWEQALPAAAAIELLHNFSLIHDDIEDVSPTRRGRKTVWKIWGINQAINSGDSMFALAHLSMNYLIERGVDAKIVVQALRRFDETCVHLTQGQHFDMDFETRNHVSVDEYVAMITGKTAVLLALCSELGALIAGAEPDIVRHYHQFGRSLGLAFQIIDDILGIWGDENLTGKSAATDILTKKKTFPVLYGLSQSQEIQTLYANEEPNDSFVTNVVKLLNQNGAYDYAKEAAITHSQNALSHLKAAQPQGQAGTALFELANMLLKRDF
ncbi:MAG: polyprenyl synthetase family protein [Chloroflexi bacterium]|nr:MAG: polyprenyl synthetase family protein [Chloroflexota bacterium]